MEWRSGLYGWGWVGSLQYAMMLLLLGLIVSTPGFPRFGLDCFSSF